MSINIERKRKKLGEAWEKADSKTKARVKFFGVIGLFVLLSLGSTVWGWLRGRESSESALSTAQVVEQPNNRSTGSNPDMEALQKVGLAIMEELGKRNSAPTAPIMVTQKPPTGSGGIKTVGVAPSTVCDLPPVNPPVGTRVQMIERLIKHSTWLGQILPIATTDSRPGAPVKLEFMELARDGHSLVLRLTRTDMQGVFTDWTGRINRLGEVVVSKRDISQGARAYRKKPYTVFSADTHRQLTLKFTDGKLQGSSGRGKLTFDRAVVPNEVEPAEDSPSDSKYPSDGQLAEQPAEGLTGQWKLVRWNGRAPTEGKDHVWIFNGGNFQWLVNGASQEDGRVSIREGVPHGQIEFRLDSGKRIHGIFRQKGAKLEICTVGVKKPRPNIFTERASGGADMMVLERAKPAEEMKTSSESISSRSVH